MRWALRDKEGKERVEAQPGAEGVCQICLDPVFAKCGKQRRWHWAHYSGKRCDHWWETETPWHRAWKGKFPDDWQEVVLQDAQTGERHIADVRTDDGLVIEFQHSPLDPHERVVREKFYGNMVWFVDGKGDYRRFRKIQDVLRAIPAIQAQQYSIVVSPGQYFPLKWLDSVVPVIFDFQSGASSTEAHDPMRDFLWCLLPGRVHDRAMITAWLRAAAEAEGVTKFSFFAHVENQIDAVGDFAVITTMSRDAFVACARANAGLQFFATIIQAANRIRQDRLEKCVQQMTAGYCRSAAALMPLQRGIRL